ncbi:MAG TPA: hypothetical protein VMU51_24850 [Mycobacteriales bacterium]|nr:hypothetical protein [Mycobacteriales bacterium]
MSARESWRPSRRRRPPAGHSDELARAWAWELAAAGLIQLTRPELELHLRGQLDRLLTTLHADPYRPQPAREVGAYLVGLDAREPDALRRTYLLLSRRLLTETPLSQDGARDRLDRLLAELITGWIDAHHTATVTAQENLRRAAGAARRNTNLGPWFTPGTPSGNGSTPAPPGSG